MSDIKYPCLECGVETNQSGYSDGRGGFWHSHCYNRLHPPRIAKQISDIISGGQDPVIARCVLKDYFYNIPINECDNIVDEYNKQIIQAWRRRCE